MAEQDSQPDPMSIQIGGGVPVASTAAGSNIAPHLAYHDLRAWIEEAHKLGEINEVKGLSWQQDIGMAAEVVLHDENAPCVIFEDVPGTPQRQPRAGQLLRRQAQEYDARLSDRSVQARTERSLPRPLHGRHEADTRRDSSMTARSFENVMTGDDVDVTKFPTPIWHERDGGRYIGTGSFNVTRDPDEGWINCGTYRVMIQDKNSVGFYISPGKHGRIHARQISRRAASRCRSPSSVGGDPHDVPDGLRAKCPTASASIDLIGGIRGAPVEVVKAPITGLPIPANAEIVIEGFVEPGNVQARRTIRRVDRLLRQRHAPRAGDGHQGDLSSQRSDPARLPAAAAARRDSPAIARLPARRSCARTSQKPASPTSRRLGARSRHGAHAARRRHQAALSRPCQQAGHVAAMCHVGRLLRAAT